VGLESPPDLKKADNAGRTTKTSATRQRYQRAIRTDLGIQRKTIRRRWLRAGQFPERKPPTGGPNSRVPGMPPNGFNYVHSGGAGFHPEFRIQESEGGFRRCCADYISYFWLLDSGF